jgi:hypothetical protein
MAINADGFYYLDPATYPPETYCGDGGEPVKLIGLAASRGKQYSTKAPNRPILYISRSNAISFDRAPSNIFNAFTGDRLLVTKGVKVTGLESASRDPRTAIGANQNGRFLIMVVADGREFSEGATFPELPFLISYGAPQACLTAADRHGDRRGWTVKHVVNKLMDENTPARSAVANHFGIYKK